MSIDRWEYMRGKPGAWYGIYNTSRKEFQFGIAEETPMLAEARLFQKIGDDARKWRFETRRLPTKTENELNEKRGWKKVEYETDKRGSLAAPSRDVDGHAGSIG